MKISRKNSPSQFDGKEPDYPVGLWAVCAACGESWPMLRKDGGDIMCCPTCGAGGETLEIRKETGPDTYEVRQAAKGK